MLKLTLNFRKIYMLHERGLIMFDNKTILITGGTGSFGKYFTKYLLKNYNLKKIIIYSRDEYKQYMMKNNINDIRLQFITGDIRDKNRVKYAFSNVDYVIHAAAMKQVPTCEENPVEAIKTNIEGAINVIDYAIYNNVQKVVALSTDKAVNPINLYGGTKFISDKLFALANINNKVNKTIFSVVRYGNVAYSRGSVIPFFKQLLTKGITTLPITDYQMTRFWIDLQQGANLVLKALNTSLGGEIFVSKVPSFKIVDLAKALNPNGKTEQVGIRRGEKLHEVMITPQDSLTTFEYTDYFTIYPNLEFIESNKEIIKKGKKVESGFEYNSNTNKLYLSVEDIKRLLSNKK